MVCNLSYSLVAYFAIGSPPDSPAQQSATINKLQINPELLTMKQSEAARILGISPSMLSKRWREAMNGRKWPYRVHRKLQVHQFKEPLQITHTTQKEINSIVTLMDDSKSPPDSRTELPLSFSPPQPQDMGINRLKLVSMYNGAE